MKVLLINGSPHERGTTYIALKKAADTLEQLGIETEIFHVGSLQSVCIDCRVCKKKGNNRCIYDDSVNEALEKAETADGFIFGTPVHYASASGLMTAFMDRAFYAGSDLFRYKPAAAVACARRAGTTAALDQLNKYMTISCMPIVSSQYWNMVHGSVPEDAPKDGEGMQIMETLAKNMAWLLKCIEFGRKNGIEPPDPEPQVRTDFIR
ncbi:flavodoxin family protein [Lacrimispora sp. NSJ-141]|uniref:Flavodoxin family protein n=1 Tax=Lientehia hominis TaxID=2897778 RepID=A0AAP2RKZ4_9FIRM|nr:flavodoxin family protein [Lientehia hominis]MCD2492855.1 flavodoxin family protein [Lientehia hominis]